MKKDTASVIVGLLLVLGGGLFLLANFGIFRNFGELFWALIFGAGGIAFLFVFVTNSRHWWALIPGFALIGIGALIGTAAVFPDLAGTLGGGIFLGALSLSFWCVYATHPENWWAIIPGGVLLTLAGVATISSTFAAPAAGGLFFLGLAATFGLVYLLPTPQGRMRWAMWPAGACLVMGFVVLLAVSSVFNYLWPLALIAGGGYLIYRTAAQRRER